MSKDKAELVSQQEKFVSSSEGYEKKYQRLKNLQGNSFISIKDIPEGQGVAGKLISIDEFKNKLGKKGETKPVLRLLTEHGEVLMDAIWSIKESMNNDMASFVGKELFFKRIGERKNEKNKRMMQIVEVFVK